MFSILLLNFIIVRVKMPAVMIVAVLLATLGPRTPSLINRLLDTEPQINAGSLLYERYHAAMWIDENLPAEVLLASWNAGQIGFFSNRSTINLDGLINSYDFLPYVRNPPFLREYLHANSVDYIVDYMIYDEIRRDSIVIHSFSFSRSTSDLTDINEIEVRRLIRPIVE